MSCRMGRNSVDYLSPLAGPWTLLGGLQAPPVGSQTLLAGPQIPLAGPETPPAGPQTPSCWPSDPISWPSDLSSGPEGYPAGSEGQPEGLQMDGWTDRGTDGWSDRWNFSLFYKTLSSLGAAALLPFETSQHRRCRAREPLTS